MNSEEPFFLVDEELVEVENILLDLDFRLKNPDFEKNQMILRTFVKACARTLKKEPKQPPAPTIPQKKLEKQKIKLEDKK